MISVIVPSLNEAGEIEDCLKSLVDQSISRSRYEIIVVDGGSVDGTVSIAKGVADRVILQEGRGIGGARRDGAKVAGGDLLAFTDADTVVSYRWLETVERNLSEYEASTGPVQYMDPDVKARLLRRWRDLYRVLNHLNFYYIIGSNMALRAEAYRRVGGHDDISLLDDYDLSMKLFRDGAKGCYDPEQVVYTSSRRAGRLLTYAATVAYGHYQYRQGKRESLLNYPKPDQMTLRSLISGRGSGYWKKSARGEKP